MLIKAGYDIRFTTRQPTPMMALLSVHPSREPDLKTQPHLASHPTIAMTEYRDGFGNVATRFVLPEGETILSNDFVIEDSGVEDRMVPGARQRTGDPVLSRSDGHSGLVGNAEGRCSRPRLSAGL